ncbi:MAG: EVE domain-containing protein [Candidatus Caldarchaeum sp.]
MPCCVLVVKDHFVGKEVIPAREVAEVRVGKKFWLVSKRVAAMKTLKEGGVAVFYATGREGRMFLGEGSFSEEPKPLTDELRFHVRGLPSEKLTHFIKLDHARLWDRTVPAEEVVEKLSFIRKRDKWQSYFRGSLRQIPEEDFNLLKSMGSSQP